MKQELLQKYKPAPTIPIQNRQWPDQRIEQAPIWCSVDLRDGNQALINPMSIEQKLTMYNHLLKLGFKEIEVGFPAASSIEYDFLRKLIEEERIPDDVTVQVLTQARPHLIEKTFEALRGTKRAILHLYNSTSMAQRKIVFRMDKEEIKNLAVQGVQLVREYTDKIDTDIVLQYSPESFTATEVDYALDVCNAVIDTWHPTPDDKMIINLPATVEVSTPNIYADQIEYMSRNIQHRDSIWISLHTHNDRGTAVAATELGLMAGADRVEGTLFGNGERTGNVDIVTLALNMYSQGMDPKLDFHDINETITVSEYCTNIPVPMRHPYAGELVYTAFSGSHQDAINKGMAWHNEQVASGQTNGSWEVPYLPIDPRDLSRSYEAIIRINSQSGKGGIAYILQNELGIEMPRKMHPEFSRIIQKKADETGMEIRSDQIYATFEEEYLTKDKPFSLVKFRSFTSERDEEKTSCTAWITINGEEKELQGEGNGPIDAFKQAILPYYDGGFTLASYHEHSLSQGSDSKAIAYLEIVNKAYDSFFGVGIDTNITISSIKAMLSALNRSLAS